MASVIFCGHFGQLFSSVIFVGHVGHSYTHFDPNFDANALEILSIADCGYISS
jgi:hypothetical protein